MKRFIGVVAAVLLSASTAMGAAIVYNQQGQAQIDGAAFAPGFAFATVGGAAGGQYQFGIGAAEPGDYAYDLQYNQQTMNDGFAASDGFSTVQGAAWQTNQQQIGGGIANGGFYAYGQGQGQIGGAAMQSNQAGTASTAGSGYIGAGATGALAAGGAITAAGQTQSYDGQYAQINTGPNSFILQGGVQRGETSTGVIAAGPGGAGLAGAGVIQAGGTAAQNNGAGTAMVGQGAAVGEAGAFAVSGGSAVAGANANASQTHGYAQFSQSPDGTSQQFQTGIVGTVVNATAVQ